MTFAQWAQVVGPIFGAIMANFFELRKMRVELRQDRQLAHERHESTTERIDDLDKRIGKLERAA